MKRIPKLPFTNEEISLLINQKESQELGHKLELFKQSQDFKTLSELKLSDVKVPDISYELTKEEKAYFYEFVNWLSSTEYRAWIFLYARIMKDNNNLTGSYKPIKKGDKKTVISMIKDKDGNLIDSHVEEINLKSKNHLGRGGIG